MIKKDFDFILNAILFIANLTHLDYLKWSFLK